MDSTMTLLNDNDLLQETAARLIKALGVDMAIFICRSNYWHGVLQLILDQKEKLAASAEDNQGSRTEELTSVHRLPQTHGQVDQRHTNIDEIAIAA